MRERMHLYKVSFLPVLGQDDHGEVIKVGRWVVYATAPNPFRVGDVLKTFLPELYEEGHSIEEEIEVKPENRAWSVSVGPEGRSYSLLIEAPDEAYAEKSLRKAVENMPILNNYVEMGLWVARSIDMTKEGVW